MALLLIGSVGFSQDPPADAPSTPESVREAGTDPEPLPPIPYELGTSYEYTWLLQGKPFATTVLRFAAVPKSDGDGGDARIALHGQLTYDRDGRILTAGTKLVFEAGGSHAPIEYRRDAEEHGARSGTIEERVLTRFEDGKITSTLDDGSGELDRTVEEVEGTVRVLDRDSPEHWALLSPYLGKIAPTGKIDLYAPTTRARTAYRITFDREENDGETVRRRYSVIGPALNGKLWTDAEGRFLEYSQEKIQIVRTAVKRPEKATDEGTAAENSKDR